MSETYEAKDGKREPNDLDRKLDAALIGIGTQMGKRVPDTSEELRAAIIPAVKQVFIEAGWESPDQAQQRIWDKIIKSHVRGK